ncbi:MAG: signal peptidase I [Coriobacteriia bacterium]|nr:signal peptidase I [Coriobacteriia bacterium]
MLLSLGVIAVILLAGGLALRYWEPLRVVGDSMRPAFITGDIAIVRKGAKVCTGDVALVREPGHGAVLHRVMGVSQNGSVTTRGDANQFDDLGSVDPSHIAGKVTAVVPLGVVIARWREQQTSATLLDQQQIRQ